MKSLLCAALLATFPLVAQAADSNAFDGTYKVQAETVHWSNGQLPEGFSLSITLDFQDGRIHYQSVNDTKPNDPKRNDFFIVLDDQAHPLPGYTRYNEIRGRQLSGDEFEVLHQLDGDVVVAEFWRFLPDGRTLVRRGVGKSPEGQSKAFEETFLRVK
ncbi:MAG: hypothetical protein ABW178_12510 [Pseudoxanthomonas sp.]